MVHDLYKDSQVVPVLVCKLFYPTHSKFILFLLTASENSLCVCPKVTNITIEREAGSLGFTLRGGAHPDPLLSRPLIVTHVRPGGPADKLVKLYFAHFVIFNIIYSYETGILISHKILRNKVIEKL